MSYTKGKWRIEASDLTIRSMDFKNCQQMGDYKGCIIADLRPALGCDLDTFGCINYEHLGRKHALDETQSNAHLIASAPDMYEALRLLMTEVRITDDTFGFGVFIREKDLQVYKQALLKAEGK